MKYKTLQAVIDNYLGYPKIIKTRDCRTIIRTSKPLITKRQVSVNDRRVWSPVWKVKSGQSIKIGYKESFLVP